MHLKSITLKGFKSFPDRTRLEFGPGVSVIVGPNGSGKSNITDAVLWALGEQSPLAVRGQSMQDVIFAGARGQQARRAAEVELVIDADGDGPPGPRGEAIEFPEVSIRRRLERTGEGEYRLNGARCRLVDVLEVLSDTGLGKEMHSVVSQGRVETVITSKPRDRRLLVEEAAGLGKHRKRRRRAQLKLDRTQDNLDRALDVEREARSRLRPLKRQAEAAELHERLERQAAEARWELARDASRARRGELAGAEAAAAQARGARDEVERGLADVAGRREAAEQALARRADRHDALTARRFAARAAQERIAVRLDQARGVARAVSRRAEAGVARLRDLQALPTDFGDDSAGRVGELEAQLAQLDRGQPGPRDDRLAELELGRGRADAECARLELEAGERRDAVAAADERWRSARQQRRIAEAAVDAAARERARVAAQIAAVDEFLQARAERWVPAGGGGALADQLEAQPGYELALTAALAGRLAAAVVPDRGAGTQLLDRSGEDGGRALIARHGTPVREGAARPPAPGAQPLAERVGGPDPALAVARALLADAWVVDRLDAVAQDFRGIAVTRGGRAWFGQTRELHQAPTGGEERVLAQRNHRAALESEAERAVEAEEAAKVSVQRAAAAVLGAQAAREAAEAALAQALGERDRAAEERRRLAWLIEQARSADHGLAAQRRAEVEAALAAERRLAEQAERARRERAARVDAERARLAAARSLVPRAERLAAALAAAVEATEVHVQALDVDLEADREAGEGLASQLRACAQEEAGLQAQLRDRAESLTALEVSAQRLRDRVAEVEAELGELAGRLGLAAQPAETALEEEQREALWQRISRLARRREQLGPVNPLAQDEYAEALEHVEELETQRHDLETALRELQALIADTDRRIRESFEQTFSATASNFEELVGQLFPGGRGRLRLVREADGPSRVLGGGAAGGDELRADDEADEHERPADEEERLGIEIEMTPAGKAMKRLSLLSGGEKSLTALAFLFAVFLARPCPFYVLDEVEAALDDLNIDRFLRLLRRYSQRAQFIVVTHQKRTMEAADTLYGVSMGDDGVSKVISRRLPRDDAVEPAADAA
ncbi:MAG: chromosome segregation SMC family protein [Solirubrobacteraceae bacterium]